MKIKFKEYIFPGFFVWEVWEDVGRAYAEHEMVTFLFVPIYFRKWV